MTRDAVNEPAAEAIPLVPINRDLFREIEVRLEARLGQASLRIEEVLGLQAGATVKLATRLADPVDVYLNGALIARGEIVAIDESFGVKLLEIADRG